MGVYSNNRTQLGTYSSEEIIANENYSHQTGLLEMMVDNIKNDQAVFEAVITNDFREAAGLVNESTEEVVNEAAGFVEKVKEFVKKCWEKVKAIFKSFIVKVNSVIIRDNKEFVNKYKKEVLQKDLSKMKYKWSAPKSGVLDGNPSIDELKKGVMQTYTTVQSTSDLSKIEEDVNSGEFLEEMLSAALSSGSTTSSEFAKDFHEDLFEDMEEEEGLKSDRLMMIMGVLTESSKSLKAIDKYQKDADKMYSEILRTVDKSRNIITKNLPSGNSDTDKGSAEILKRQNLGYKVIQVMQTAAQKIIGAGITECKFHIAQCRRVFAQAASFNPKSVRENAMFIEAIGESAEFEIMSSFEDYSL